MTQKKIKIPPVNSMVKVVWLDSGVMSQGRSDTAPEDVKLFHLNEYGKLKHANDERIVVVNEDNDKDTQIIYSGIAISSIKEIKDFGKDE